MFQGSHNIVLDSKGRIAIPAKIRECLMELCGGQIVMTSHLRDRCIVIYPMTEWQDLSAQLQKLSAVNRHVERAQRMMIGGCDPITLDGNGRVLIAQPLRNYAKLDKNLLLVGLGKKMELWDQEIWTRTVVEADLGDEPVPPEMLSLML